MDIQCHHRCRTRIDCFSNCVRQSRCQHRTCRRCMRAVHRILSVRLHWWRGCHEIAFVRSTDGHSLQRFLVGGAHIVPTICDFGLFESVGKSIENNANIISCVIWGNVVISNSELALALNGKFESNILKEFLNTIWGETANRHLTTHVFRKNLIQPSTHLLFEQACAIQSANHSLWQMNYLLLISPSNHVWWGKNENLKFYKIRNEDEYISEDEKMYDGNCTMLWQKNITEFCGFSG